MVLESFGSAGQKLLLLELVCISVFSGLPLGLTRMVMRSLEVSLNLCQRPSGWKLKVAGLGDSDADAVLGVFVGVGVRVGVAVLTAGVCVGVDVAVRVAVRVAVGVSVSVGLGVLVGVSVGVAVGSLYFSFRVKLPVLPDLKVVASMV